jgi:hypothetical protein
MMQGETLGATLRKLRSDRRGITAAMIGLTLTGTIGLSALVIDIGNTFQVRRSMQASADSAALAGAAQINCCSGAAGTAITTARTYSAQAGQYNATSINTVTIPAGYPQLKCLTSIGVSCTGPDSANAIVVRQTSNVPTIFARLFGITSIPVTVTSTASLAGGTSKPLEIMMVLDTTGSMNTSDSSCGQTRLGCAQAGARTLLGGVSPSVSRVGLMVYPPTTSASQAAKNFNCSTDTAAIAKYNATNPVYSVLGLGNDFRTADDAATLNATSNLSRAFKGGGNGCPQGISAVGGVGTYFADAITAAQSSLVTNGRVSGGVPTQRVIILLSDGDAGADASNISAAKYANQCKQAVTAAAAAKAAGTWVYSIAYGAPTSSSSSCPTDSPRISACSTMQQIASDSTKFYSSQSGGGVCNSAANPTSGLNSIFSSISQTFRGTRLLPNSTT